MLIVALCVLIAANPKNGDGGHVCFDNRVSVVYLYDVDTNFCFFVVLNAF